MHSGNVAFRTKRLGGHKAWSADLPQKNSERRRQNPASTVNKCLQPAIPLRRTNGVRTGNLVRRTDSAPQHSRWCDVPGAPGHRREHGRKAGALASKLRNSLSSIRWGMSGQRCTVHSDVHISFVVKPYRKNPVDTCQSCRGRNSPLLRAECSPVRKAGHRGSRFGDGENAPLCGWVGPGGSTRTGRCFQNCVAGSP